MGIRLKSFCNRSPFIMAFLLLAGLVLLGAQAFADESQTAVEQAREAGNLVRSAERHFHAGRLDQARDELAQAENLLEAAEAEGDLPQVRSARSRFDRLNQSVQRRLDQEKAEKPAAEAAPSAAAPAPAADTTPEQVAPAATEPPPRLSGAQARNYRLVDQDMRSTRNRLNDPRWWEYSQSDRDQRLEQAAAEADGFRTRLDELNAELDPALLKAEPVQNSEAQLAEIRNLIAQRRGESEPVEEVSPAVAEALELEQAILALHQAHHDRFQGVHGNSMVHGTTMEEQMQTGREAVEQLDALERDVIPAIQATLQAVAENYGESAGAINNALHALGLSNEHHLGSRFMDLFRGLENVARTRRASAQDLVRRAGIFTDDIESYSEEMRLPRLEEAREMLALGRAFDPADTELNQRLAEVDAQYAAMSERIERDIDARQWAGDIGDFAGPGQTDELSSASLAFFRAEPAWNPAGRGVEILAVSVQGQWDVANRDLLGRVIQWRVPVHMVMTNTEMKEDNIARVYELSVLAREGGPDQAGKAPPFVEYWVGNSWNMRLSNVPVQP